MCAWQLRHLMDSIWVVSERLPLTLEFVMMKQMIQGSMYNETFLYFCYCILYVYICVRGRGPWQGPLTLHYWKAIAFLRELRANTTCKLIRPDDQKWKDWCIAMHTFYYSMDHHYFSLYVYNICAVVSAAGWVH